MTQPQNERQRVVVLGGYGNFGRRIVAALANEPACTILIAGRDAKKAHALAQQLGGNTEPWAINYRTEDLAAKLATVGAHVLIHTAGPFQAQDYAVARACIASECHYIDIADGREYVTHIGQLSDAAARAGVLITSGASSLPALSSAVVDHYHSSFAAIERIEHGISAGAKPPGIATMQGVLSYLGKPFTQWRAGAWQLVHGWQGLASHRFPGKVGKRWLGCCDVPDLDLFPVRYSPVDTVVFRAGVGFTSTTWIVWLLSWLVRAGLADDIARYSESLHRVAAALEPLGSRWSGMYVQVEGRDAQGRPLIKNWTLLAGSDHGPNIPCFPVIALARKLLRGEVTERGAMPCMGLLSVEEILNATPGLNLHVVAD
jgi:saccharopine dehydrogenase-like NADP-dependent oxidoreductase